MIQEDKRWKVDIVKPATLPAGILAGASSRLAFGGKNEKSMDVGDKFYKKVTGKMNHL